MSDISTAAPLAMLCGPTCGCGKATPFVRGGGDNYWMCPAACMHCGKSFGASWATTMPGSAALTYIAPPPDKAQSEIAELRSSLSAEREARAKLEGAIRWALGETGDFPPPPEFSGLSRPTPRYYWRSELRERAFGSSLPVSSPPRWPDLWCETCQQYRRVTDDATTDAPDAIFAPRDRCCTHCGLVITTYLPASESVSVSANAPGETT